MKSKIFETKDILLLHIIIRITGLPRRGFATREPAKEAERVASHVAKGRDLVKFTPTSFLTGGTHVCTLLRPHGFWTFA